MSENPTQKLFEYISLLENVNEQLVNTLKRCIEVLTELKSSVPDPDGWQDMLNTFKEATKVGERITGKKPTLH